MSNGAQELGAEMVAPNDDGRGTSRTMFEDICRGLNLDCQTEQAANKLFDAVTKRMTLEGDPTLWYCCAVYTACRQTTTPTVSNQDAIVIGNCVSLSNLLRICHMSISEFQTKIKQWCHIADLPEAFIKQINELERKFSITFTLLRKYKKIFEQLFFCPPNERKNTKYSVLHGSRSHGKCSYLKLDDFCWRFFLCAKNQKPTATVDLVTSYNLMICCMNLVYVNVLAEKRIDLINRDFEGVPPNLSSPDFSEAQAREHCILKHFCEMYEEANAIKSHVFADILQTFFQSNTIFGNKETQLGLISNENIDRNLKSLNISYEQYVLSVGEFDERMLASYPLDANEHGHINHQSLRSPLTPFTRRNDLPANSAKQTSEPVTNATNNVRHIQEFIKLSGILPEPAIPTDEETKIKLERIIEQMKTKFQANYIGTEAEARFTLARRLYYTIFSEIQRNLSKPNTDLSHETFNIALMTACLELVLVAYTSEVEFPWILECFNISAFEFHKILEIVVRHGCRNAKNALLPRALIKHLNSIEETCLERLVWLPNSPLWPIIAATTKPLPTYSSAIDRADGPLHIFLRKVYTLGWLRIKNLCTELQLCDDKRDKTWNIFEHSISEKPNLMQERHLDQMIMCAIYIYIRVTKMEDPKFRDIMQAYRNQPQAVNSVYREVLINVNENGERIFSDIIQFYNNTYVPEMTSYAMKFSNETVQRADLLLSPHPVERLAQPKKLTPSIFVTKMSKNEIQQSPNNMSYIFHSSPAKALEAMNERVCGGFGSGKRVLFNDDVGGTDVKRMREPILN